MNAVKTRQLAISDVTGRVKPPFTLNNNEQAMMPDPFTTSLVFTVTGYKFKGGFTNGGLDPHIPLLRLKSAVHTTLLCTNGILLTTDAANNNHTTESICSTVGTNGNFGGVGQPAAPPQFTNAPTLGFDDWTFTLTRNSDDSLTWSVVSNDPIYAGISWGDTVAYTHVSVAPMEVWFGRMDPVVQAWLVAYGYSGQYELQDGVTGVTVKSVVIS